MNVFVELRFVRTILGAAVAVRALAWGAVAGLTLFAGAALIDLATPLSLALRSTLFGLAVAASLIVVLVLVWHDRTVMMLEQVALWVEGCFPALEYALVTAVESGRDDLAAAVAPARWVAMARDRAARAIGPPLAIVVAVVVVILLLPRGAVARVRSPRAGDSLERPRTHRGSAVTRLTPLIGRVVPPAYTDARATTVDEPSDVRALSGSTLTLAGLGDGAGITARVAADPSVGALSLGDRWQIAIRIGSEPMAIQLSDGQHRRVIVVEPVPDSAPAVTLVMPAHDSVLRTPTGRIALAATANDDFGIAAAWFEYIISSGEGETFTFRSGRLGAIGPRNRRVSFNASLSLDSLALKPGDIVHLRAVAHDANDISGPGVGVSDTRSLRVARAGEYDSIAVDAAAPTETDKSVISERMLVVLAEALEKKRSTLARDAVVGESRAIAADQRTLRRTVGELVFTRLGGDPTGEEHRDDASSARATTIAQMLARADSATNRSADPIDFEGGESPVVALNKPLLEAYDAMWDATMSLELGEPARALPHMRRALLAMQRARRAERVYLRGAASPIVIDVEKARLKGKDTGASSARRGVASLDPDSRRRTERLARIVELSAHDPRAAVDSVLVLRIDALGHNPRFAAALSDAAEAIRHHKTDDAALAFVRARRALVGSPVSRDSLSRWGGDIVP